MAEHTPTAWDLDVRSFMSDLLRGSFSAQPLNMPGVHLINQAILMADEVQKARGARAIEAGERAVEGAIEELGLVVEARRGYPAGAPDKLPPYLPVGTRIAGEDEESLSMLERRSVGYGRVMYYGRFSGGPGWWDARDIDWEHWSRTATPETPK